MKNILIPTILSADTINAVKTAVSQSKGENITIYLMLVSEIPDTFSSVAFIRNVKNEMTVSQTEVLEVVRCITDCHANCSLKIHHQYGISAPILKNLIAHFQINLSIVTPSYKEAQKRIHKHTLKIMANSKCPILHLSANFKEHDVNKAMYLEYDKSRIQAKDIQHMQEQFNFSIVSQAKVFEDQTSEEIAPLLADAISKNSINMLIETRKPERISLKKKEKSTINETLGLPVLSLYEEIV